jgi:Cu2+-containing amine oxidase
MSGRSSKQSQTPGGSSWRSLVVVFFVVGIVVTLGALASQGDEAARTDDPAPFDPLREEEASRAINLTLSNATLAEERSDRTRVIGASLYTEKSFRDAEEVPRMSEVWVYDYEANTAIRALVDLDAGDLQSWSSRDVQPPLTAEEIDHAGSLALEDERVRERLEERGLDPDEVQGTARLWTGSSEAACPENRCALVGFEDGTDWVHEFAVLVDLVDDSVRDIVHPAEPDHHQGGSP